MSFRLAVVQPLAQPPPADERNVSEAVRHVEAATHAGDPVPLVRHGDGSISITLPTIRMHTVVVLAHPTGDR